MKGLQTVAQETGKEQGRIQPKSPNNKNHKVHKTGNTQPDWYSENAYFAFLWEISSLC